MADVGWTKLSRTNHSCPLPNEKEISLRGAGHGSQWTCSQCYRVYRLERVSFSSDTEVHCVWKEIH